MPGLRALEPVAAKHRVANLRDRLVRMGSIRFNDSNPARVTTAEVRRILEANWLRSSRPNDHAGRRGFARVFVCAFRRKTPALRQLSKRSATSFSGQSDARTSADFQATLCRHRCDSLTNCQGSPCHGGCDLAAPFASPPRVPGSAGRHWPVRDRANGERNLIEHLVQAATKRRPPGRP